MIVIIGCIIVTACVLGGFTWAGGHVHALWHPSEILTIGGAALGALIIMSSKKMLIDLVKGILATIKGAPYSKKMYQQLFQLTFELFKAARRDGLLGLEVHLSNPHNSEIFNKYPLISNNHHVCHFLCDGLTPMVDGVAHEQLSKYMEAEMRTIEEEHHSALNVLNRVCDALPGFGIVAAVLGIVVTMAHIDGPASEIGHKVGAALVGTFLGILASYGFMSPIAGRMEAMGHEEMAFFKTISSILVSYAESGKPKESLELARRGVNSEYRPSIAEMEELLKDVGGAAA